MKKRNQIAQAKYRNQLVRMGAAWVAETSRKPTLDALVSDIASDGGEVIRIDTEQRQNGAHRRTTVYTVIFIMPDEWSK